MILWFENIQIKNKDKDFAERLHADLQNNGVRCWFAPEDMKIGNRIRQAIDKSIRIRDKLLLILSESSIKSQWVEKEVETASAKLESIIKKIEDLEIPDTEEYKDALDEINTRTPQVSAQLKKYLQHARKRAADMLKFSTDRKIAVFNNRKRSYIDL